ncbi:hypothetical protein AK830_g8242 [Neonectria ditissima]|uniref:Uncharacterized protein n=1 Tax=Neonectria ditissima TaxID=78410 RepID=A0A0P7AXY8_9HYPO|nr:hypothetical protein AK830_g8242 [Neonectria ditissima]
MKAASEGWLNVIRLLVDKGASLEAIDEDGGPTALMTAVLRKQRDAVQYLLRIGARIEASDQKKQTALWKAASAGYADIVQILLDAGADIETRDLEGQTPLFAAAAKGSFDTVDGILWGGVASNIDSGV